MPIEKCHHCTYGDELAGDAELVIDRCPVHAQEWDPTIEDQERRAAMNILEGAPPTTPPPRTLAVSLGPSCPYCAPSLPCTTHQSIPRPHPHPELVPEFDVKRDRGHSPAGLRPYEPPTIKDGRFPER
jgi:hypothetical protein